MQKKIPWTLATACLFLGVAFTLLAQFVIKRFEIFPSQPEKNELHLGQTDYINPLLDCPAATTDAPPKHDVLESLVRKIIQEKKDGGEIVEASVYFRDLNNGPSFGIDSQTLFSSASLLKVPILIAYFKKLEEDPTLFKKNIRFEAKIHRNSLVTQTIQMPDAFQEGQSYQIDFLIYRMITLSDNDAAIMLLMSGPGINIVDTLKDMGLKLSMQPNGDTWIGVNSYATIFRILYNATYLTRAHSRSALELLSESKMRDGLQAGVPYNLKVSHKFGERTMEGVSQFHDCGIVYYPVRPYLLCIMTRGKRGMPDLIKTVADISKGIFAEIAKGH